MKTYIINCIDAFDLDGDCITSLLPYDTTSDFACDLDDANAISRTKFLEHVAVDTEYDSYYVTPNDVYIAYNEETDVHYFFN